jgi:serine/threonine protein kinase
MDEKIRILCGITRGLAELHTIGIVHADLKPENVFLSGDNPSKIRLGDFGLSIMRDTTFTSTLALTAHMRGTPLYSAPEMLPNPFAQNVDAQVAKPSRKTDMYAFAVLAWELLTQSKPFSSIANETVLCTKVHQVRAAI